MVSTCTSCNQILFFYIKWKEPPPESDDSFEQRPMTNIGQELTVPTTDTDRATSAKSFFCFVDGVHPLEQLRVHNSIVLKLPDARSVNDNPAGVVGIAPITRVQANLFFDIDRQVDSISLWADREFYHGR